MSWKETMAYAKKYNTARGQDNWKHVGVGDKVTMQGGSQESSSSSGSAPPTTANTTSTPTTTNSTTSTTDNSPALDFELNINFGAGYKEKINILGFNEKVEVNAFSVDLMTWNWNSSSPTDVQYTPYRSAYSSVDFGTLLFGGGASYDWSNFQGSAHGHLGMLEGSTNGSPRFTVFDIGGQWGFGVNVKMTANPQKVLNSYIKVCSDYNNSFPGWRSFMH